MTLYESSIYAGLRRLIKLIYTAKYLSTKADRINYIEPNIRYLEKSLCNFIMAFNGQEKRRDYMDECIGAFGVFRVLFEQNRDLGVIHFIRKRDKDDMLYILRTCVFSYPTLHANYIGDRDLRKLIEPEKSITTKPLGVGAAIGHLIWQMAVTYYFNDIIL